MDCSILIPSLRPVALDLCVDSIGKSVGVTYEILVDRELGGIYKAVERLLIKSKGNYILHIPDDCLILKDSIFNMIKFCGDRFVLGDFRSRNKDFIEDGPSLTLINRMPFSRFPFIKKSFIDLIGGFMDTRYNSFYGDPDLSMRVWSSGGIVETCPDAWLIGVEEKDLVHLSSKKQYEKKDRELFENRWN